MFRSALYHNNLLLLIIASVCLKLFSLNEVWVEKYYTYGIYPFLSSGSRLLFGWIPFSIGDVVYTLAGLYIALKIFVFIRQCIQKGFRHAVSRHMIFRGFKIAVAVYLLFNLLWGLNYNRLGIAHQLHLSVVPYSETDLINLLVVINDRLCYYGERVNLDQRAKLQNNDFLFAEGTAAFRKTQEQLSFLKYENPSLKASLYSPLGQYVGFTGYYNPFTAEAQIKESLPVFLRPFVVCHEIGHGIGYAKENEANFVSFLACRQSDNADFRYSVYFEMWLYTMREQNRRQPQYATMFLKTLHPQVQKDYEEFLAYLKSTDNKVEPYFSRFYDRYLKLNNQPQGKATYNEVVAWMIAYMKKMGAASI